MKIQLLKIYHSVFNIKKFISMYFTEQFKSSILAAAQPRSLRHDCMEQPTALSKPFCTGTIDVCCNVAGNPKTHTRRTAVATLYLPFRSCLSLLPRLIGVAQCCPFIHARCGLCKLFKLVFLELIGCMAGGCGAVYWHHYRRFFIALFTG